MRNSDVLLLEETGVNQQREYVNWIFNSVNIFHTQVSE